MNGPNWRIALVMATPGGNWGGMETHVQNLALALAARGHEVHILLHPDFLDRFPEPLKTHPLPMHMGRRNPLLTCRLRRALKKIKPDICHAHGNKAAALIRAVRARGTARIGTVHGQKSSLAPFQHLDGAIAVNQALYQRLPSPMKTLIWNGINPPTIRPLSLPTGYSRPLVIAAGRLEPVKGFGSLINAWAKAGCPGHLVIAGEGSLRRQLEQQVLALALNDSVSFIGHSDCLGDWLASADACVISSVREGFPYLMIEALHCGCPVLATPVGGITDVLPAQFLAQDCSEQALAKLLRQQLVNPAQLKQAQAPCFERARTTFTVAAMADRTCQFYRDCLEVSSASPDGDG